MSCKTLILSFVVFEQLLDVLKLAVFVKYNSLISYENNERTNFSLWKLDRKFFLIQSLDAMRKYIHCGTCTPILVGFGQLLDVLKSAIFEKRNYSYLQLLTNGILNFFPGKLELNDFHF